MSQFNVEVFNELMLQKNIMDTLTQIQEEYKEDGYSLEKLYTRVKLLYKEGMSEEARINTLIKSAVELITKEAPKWEFIASRLLMCKANAEIHERMQKGGITSFYEKLLYLTKEQLYGEYILENYNKEEIDSLATYMKEERTNLLNYSGLDLLLNRYVIRSHSHELLETPQEMFMGIAMHLALNEKEKVKWAKAFYDLLSQLKVTVATPTMSNARKPYYQLSSCFIDTVPDSLEGIYRSITNFAQVSKFGGGMGLYFGKVRANGSSIRGFEGAAGGVIRWIKLANDTATAVDQLGVRQGAVACYLDVWHKDLPEFLQLRTNNGDDRMKAHDVFTGVCYPDLFWKIAKEDIEGDWHLMCPHEIQTVMGYALEDFYGEEWEKRYLECIKEERISKRTVKIKDLIRLILKSSVETGAPFTFNRDHVNKMNPNGHEGMIYCSNLCTEIAQNMSEIKGIKKEVKVIDGQTVVVESMEAGDFVVCNLASLTLPNIEEDELEDVVYTITRALDNVIDLNFYPLEYAKITNRDYRPIGLGASGYHHLLAKKDIPFESQEHLDYIEDLFEKINFYAIKASSSLAAEKGMYSHFEGSDWQTGAYFEKRHYESEMWVNLKAEVAKNGMRNGYLLAIAPTSSTSIISGTTASIDPIMKKYYIEEKKGALIPRVAPDLNAQTVWLYKNAHYMDQTWLVKAAAIRQRHIDQAQSLNLYITPNFSMRKLLDLYLLAWEEGVKTIYYVRSQSLEVEECDSCSA